MEKKFGVYICTGCGIGEGLDIEKLKGLPQSGYGIELCKTHSFCCGPDGLAEIRQDIAKEGINTIIIAACSPRVNQEVFDFGPDKIVERVNLREQVIWCQPSAGEGSGDGVALDTQLLAQDYMRMGIVKAKKSELPSPYLLQTMSKKVLVMGGGDKRSDCGY